MKLKCPACGAPIAADNINMQQLVAVCPNCDNVFPFDSAFKRRMPRVDAPEQVTLYRETSADGLDLAFKWDVTTEPPIGILGIAIALAGAAAAIVGVLMGAAPPSLLMILLPMLYPAYALVTLFTNSTRFTSDGHTLTVETTPLYFPRYGTKRVQIDEVETFLARRPDYAPFPDGKEGFYDVVAQYHDGSTQVLAAIVNYQHAHFLAQELNTHLDAQATFHAPARLNGDAPDTDLDDTAAPRKAHLAE